MKKDKNNENDSHIEKENQQCTENENEAVANDTTTSNDGGQQQQPEGVSDQATEAEPVDSVDDLKTQLDAMGDRYVRLMAEFDNFKKRVSRDYERLVESANEKLMLELIEVRENFDRAVRTEETGGELERFCEGMKMIYSKFDDILRKNGLEPFGEVGEEFDPQIHDALMKTANETIEEDHVGEVFEKGYYLKNKVIKHAKVIVSSGKPSENNE